ncbi:MAG: cellulase family glycosylhydrolase [Clostridiales bacterium]|nr:cellulase family glycosylhydrolase [Clostridiales bacterium]
MLKHRFLRILIAALLSCAVLSSSACIVVNRPHGTDEPDPEPPEQVELTFLKAEGESVKNANGEDVYLRGVNLGGMFVTEHWMTGFSYTTKPNNDYKSLSKTFIERFGEEKTKALWKEYHENWWSELDYKNCAEMGINVIRLPFSYMNVDFSAITSYEHAGESYDFSDLDAFVTKAAEYGIYTILDLHGAYGSQNGQDHSGEIFDSASQVTFYSNPEMMNLTVKLWSALSEHYKDNPYVAGYDILNEPGEKAGLTSERHFAFYDKVYDAIRATGDEHIVIFESCWDGKDLPQPSMYGWENCIYSFHHYTNNNTNDDANTLAHGQSWNEKIEGITKQNFGVPIYMGEFTNYTTKAKWDYVLGQLNRLNWHWTSWTYKVCGGTPWGIVDIRLDNDDKIDANIDEYDDIIAKIKLLRTDGAKAKEYTFPDGKTTLKSVFKRYTQEPPQTEKLEEEMYVFDTDSGFLGYKGVVGGTTVFNLSDDYYASSMLKLSYHPSGDGSVYFKFNNLYMCVFTNGGTKYLTLKTLSNTSDADARFYPVSYGGGWAFISRSACKFIAENSDGLLVLSASTLDEAAIFYYS